jgi:hypothetical protein
MFRAILPTFAVLMACGQTHVTAPVRSPSQSARASGGAGKVLFDTGRIVQEP